ncbi:MAG TPA: hypothetical protein VE093_13480 [Polyangiaceae bacterium]|jgi:hypothetical protein|nr:hypothetical protein [Polyangiaceae bacterium]
MLESDHKLDDIRVQSNNLELAFTAACSLGVPLDEVYACLVDDDLRPQKMKTQPFRATAGDLDRLVKFIARRADPGDALLFIAVNHGATTGLTTAEDVADPLRDDELTVLTPDRLDACLRMLSGPQVLVVSTCHAGVFLPLADTHPDRMVLAVCDAEETYSIQRTDCPVSAFLDELFAAWCECSLDDAIPKAKLPLDEAFLRAAERLAAQPGMTTPRRAGHAAWPRFKPPHQVR